MPDAPSIPPDVNWPMVGFKFVKDLPYTLAVIGGCAFALRYGGELLTQSMIGLIGPVIVAAFGKSRPSEH